MKIYLCGDHKMLAIKKGGMDIPRILISFGVESSVYREGLDVVFGEGFYQKIKNKEIEWPADKMYQKLKKNKPLI
jgi:hypothetical protein